MRIVKGEKMRVLTIDEETFNERMTKIIKREREEHYYNWKTTLILMIVIFATIFLIIWLFPYVNDAALNRRGSYVPGWFE